ncbi:MAG TPA: PqqD family protein [Candidatus Solibacter sp.]|nr:PqqD family protein [Candidatus Solibacter sp.]
MADRPSIGQVRIPEHVVFRPFGNEMVVLNLQSGQYHGLNHSGSRMLEVLSEVGDFNTAARMLAKEFAHPVARISEDLAELCEALAKRALVEIDPVGPVRPGDDADAGAEG